VVTVITPPGAKINLTTLLPILTTY